MGRIELLPESIKEVLTRLENVTKNYNNYFLNIALAYGGQYELVDAVKKIGEKIKDGKLRSRRILQKKRLNQICIHISFTTIRARYDFTHIR